MRTSAGTAAENLPCRSVDFRSRDCQVLRWATIRQAQLRKYYPYLALKNGTLDNFLDAEAWCQNLSTELLWLLSSVEGITRCVEFKLRCPDRTGLTSKV